MSKPAFTTYVTSTNFLGWHLGSATEKMMLSMQNIKFPIIAPF